MSVLVDARPHLAAVKAAVTAAGVSAVYDHSEVPGTTEDNPGELPDIFVLIAVERRASPVLRSARAGNAGWRILATALGGTVLESAWALNRIALALNEQRLTVDGAVTTPLQLESQDSPRLDDGRFRADAFYTYVH